MPEIPPNIQQFIATISPTDREGFYEWLKAQKSPGQAAGGLEAPGVLSQENLLFGQLRELYQQNASFEDRQRVERELAGLLAPNEQARIVEINERENAREESRRIPYLARQLYHPMANGSWLDQNGVPANRELLQRLFPGGDFVIREAASNYWNALAKYERRDPGSGRQAHETKNTLGGAIDNEAGVTEDEFKRLGGTEDELDSKQKDFISQLTAEAMIDMEAARVAAREARETVFKKRGDFFEGLAEKAGIKKAAWDGSSYQIEYEEILPEDLGSALPKPAEIAAAAAAAAEQPLLPPDIVDDPELSKVYRQAVKEGDPARADRLFEAVRKWAGEQNPPVPFNRAAIDLFYQAHIK